MPSAIKTEPAEEVILLAPKPLAETYAVVVDHELLHEERKDKGLSYRGLAARIDAKSWSQLRRLELPLDRGGHHTLSVERAVRIAAALDIPAHRLHKYFRFHGVEASAA